MHSFNARTASLDALKGPPLRYKVKMSLLSPALITRFTELRLDEPTLDFIEAGNGALSLVRDGAAKVLRSFLSVTDANALTGRGGMFVFSLPQLALLGLELDELGGGSGSGSGGGALLDIGAGDGGVTAVLAPHFSRVVTTELSGPMAGRLRGRGWECKETADLGPEVFKGAKFELVQCLNVLDRADKPLTLLRQLRELVQPETGRLLLAVVLPWCPFVEDGSNQRRPTETLPMKGGTCCEGKPSPPPRASSKACEMYAAAPLLLSPWLPSRHGASRTIPKWRGSGAAVAV